MVRKKNTSLKVEEAKQKLRAAASEEPTLLVSMRAAARRYPKTGLLAGFATGLMLGMSAQARHTVGSFLSSMLADPSRHAPSHTKPSPRP